jgi:DNA primase
VAQRKSENSHQSNYFLSREKLVELLNNIGVTISSETAREILCYCPFHSNRDTPAFNISVSPGHMWKCHNGKCGAKGNIVSLLTKKGYSRSEARMMLAKGVIEISDIEKAVRDILFPVDYTNKAEEDWREVDPGTFRKHDEKNDFPAKSYMLSRGITQEAVDYFGIGYSKGKHMAVIPVFNEASTLVGVIGREIATKRYQYSTGLGRGQLIWNINNAREHDSIILTEGSLDAVYVWQTGHENVGAVLGSSISPNQWRQLRKYFTEVTCFFDNDEAGQALTDSIIDGVADLSVYVVKYPDRMIQYEVDGEIKERPVKDPGELTEDEIREMISNRKSSIELLFES